MTQNNPDLTVASKISVARAEKHLSSVDLVMSELIAKFGQSDLKPHKDYYGALLRAIVSQQLSVKAANTIYLRFLALFNDNIVSPELVFSTNHQILRSAGLSNSKVNYVKDLSQKIITGELELDKISLLDNQSIINELIKVKGIGVWSSHMFLIFCVGRLNVLPIGDLGIRRGCLILYGLASLPNEQQLLNLSQQNKWDPYRSVASWYIWQSLNNRVA
jgi:DNA-3-methyladenine glycosylase II